MSGGTSLTVNGQLRSIAAEPQAMLLDVLRSELGLKAARFGCGEGLCGSCRVLVDGRAVASCDMPLWSVAGKAITTVEGLGTPEAPHPIQTALIAEQAMQCGYCISGIMISAVALLAETPEPSETAIREALDPNLCRCGAHIRIIRAVHRAAAEMQARVA
ncbi:(2Fe-2S)-binding protein [Bosea sp. (in: a-proteobacteria)]|jgi:nicotinate dehydrogenase subunit A|uniref:(2Fe-2S)-binding protein n=1 Tax=Bosea sp. (in: a-proteobacteria) TaxID=1871050 RepID=UPI00356A96AD